MKRHISYLKKIAEGRLTNRRIPILVTLCVTNKCNLRCVYCYKENIRTDNQEFNSAQILSLIDELAGAGTQYISLNGGEALLKDGIEDIVERIKQKNMLCHLSTNGLMVEDKIDVIKKVDSLAISVDGAKISNDANRGDGSFDRIIKSMETLRRNRIMFHTHTVLTKNNKQGLNEMMLFAHKYKFKAQFSILRADNHLARENCLSDEELKESIQKIMAYKRNGFPVFFTYESYENMLDWPLPYSTQAIFGAQPKGYRQMPCYIKRFSCHIEPNGLVYPCIVLVGKIKAMNLLKSGFKQAWGNLAGNECRGCYNICCNELNLIFGLKPSAVWNAGKIALGRLFTKK